MERRRKNSCDKILEIASPQKWVVLVWGKQNFTGRVPSDGPRQRSRRPMAIAQYLLTDKNMSILLLSIRKPCHYIFYLLFSISTQQRRLHWRRPWETLKTCGGLDLGLATDPDDLQSSGPRQPSWAGNVPGRGAVVWDTCKCWPWVGAHDIMRPSLRSLDVGEQGASQLPMGGRLPGAEWWMDSHSLH